jgi:hypothetical protein
MKNYIMLLICIIMLGLSYIILKITTCDYGIDYETIKSMGELQF